MHTASQSRNEACAEPRQDSLAQRKAARKKRRRSEPAANCNRRLALPTASLQAAVHLRCSRRSAHAPTSQHRLALALWLATERRLAPASGFALRLSTFNFRRTRNAHFEALSRLTQASADCLPFQATLACCLLSSLRCSFCRPCRQKTQLATRAILCQCKLACGDFQRRSAQPELRPQAPHVRAAALPRRKLDFPLAQLASFSQAKCAPQTRASCRPIIACELLLASGATAARVRRNEIAQNCLRAGGA